MTPNISFNFLGVCLFYVVVQPYRDTEKQICFEVP